MELRISPEMSIEEVTHRYPQTADLFIRHRMGCVGCSLGLFHTIAEVAAIYKFEVETFITQLNERIEAEPRGAEDNEDNA